MPLAAEAIVAIVAATASAASAGVSGYSSYQSGKSQERMAKYNADLLNAQAATTERDSRIQANAQREEAARLAARQRAIFAGAGIVGTEGTPLMVAAQQAAQGELAALETERAGGVEAGNMRQQSLLERMAGKSARQAGTLGAWSGAFGVAGAVASGYASASLMQDKFGKPAADVGGDLSKADVSSKFSGGVTGKNPYLTGVKKTQL